MKPPIRNITMYRVEEVRDTHEGVVEVVRSSAECGRLWHLFQDKIPVDGEQLTTPDVLSLLLMTVAHERDEARRELESIAQEQLADARAKPRTKTRSEPTVILGHFGEPTRIPS